MNNLRIVLYQTREQQVYHPGETISGAVEFTLTEPKHYDCIKVDFVGSRHVEWTYNYGKTNYDDIETYVQDSLVLWNPQQSNGGSIGPGSFSLRFQFIIPSHVPSSFGYQNPSFLNNGSSGYISYMVEARAVTGAFRFDHKASAPVLITRLTSISGANQVTPVREVKRKQVGCLCCTAGDVEFVAKLPRTGYCVTNGDIIPLTVDVQNNSKRVIHMKAEIMKRVALFIVNSIRDHENITWSSVVNIFSEPIQPGASYVWNPTNWVVPALTPTLFGSRIINVDYVLEVSAVIPNAINLRCTIPLVMGNLPYMAAGNLEPHVLFGATVTALVPPDIASATSQHDVEDFDDSSERDTLI